MTTADNISLSNIYLDMITESTPPYSFDEVMSTAVREALYGRTFPFEFIGRIADDNQLEYISHANTPIGSITINNIIKAYLNNSIRIVWEGKSKDKIQRAMERIRTLVGDKYKEERKKYV